MYQSLKQFASHLSAADQSTLDFLLQLLETIDESGGNRQVLDPYNNHHYLENYDREEMMITDNINPIPRELWKWGIVNRSGRLRTFSEDIVKLNLMPADQATITAKGIKFKKLYYTCEKARKEQWFERARSKLLTKDEKSLNISYDPRKPDFIYLRSPDGREYEKCLYTT